jgi:predicted Zn-dependent protease with MMP-like domain
LTPDLFGLFIGTNLRDESVFNVPGLPTAIYIFQRNLERACRSREELISEIGTTLYHELGHYLGLDEDDLYDLGVD